MIDYDRLNQAYDERRFYALQLEVGDLCHQGCIYCYMNALDTPVNNLSDQQIQNIVKDSKRLGITAIEWLGGEPLLRKSIFDHMALSADLAMRNNVWTGGLPLKEKKVLKNTIRFAKKGLIAVHLSTVDPEIYKKLHPGRQGRQLQKILESIHGMLDSGYPSSQLLNSATFTGLQSSQDMIETIDYFEDTFNIKTSLNVYHTYLRPDASIKQLDRFIPPAAEVEEVYLRYAEQWGINEYPMNCVNKQYCSATLAVLCDGSVTPCATIRPQNAQNIHQNLSFYDIVNKNREELIFARFRDTASLPQSCRICDLNQICFGCRSRAYAAGKGIYGKDPRCFR